MTKATRDALVKVYGTLTRAGWDRAGSAEASPARSPASQPSIGRKDGPVDDDPALALARQDIERLLDAAQQKIQALIDEDAG